MSYLTNFANNHQHDTDTYQQYTDTYQQNTNIYQQGKNINGENPYHNQDTLLNSDEICNSNGGTTGCQHDQVYCEHGKTDIKIDNAWTRRYPTERITVQGIINANEELLKLNIMLGQRITDQDNPLELSKDTPVTFLFDPRIQRCDGCACGGDDDNSGIAWAIKEDDTSYYIVSAACPVIVISDEIEFKARLYEAVRVEF